MHEREDKKKKTPLEEAMETFIELLPEMLKNYEGQWVVFGPEDKEPVGGYWHCEDDARKIGIGKYGPKGDYFVALEVSRKHLPKEIAPQVALHAAILPQAN